ncbi:MAG TPA: glycosyltransferase family 2 protein [Polyangiaceae bacterium]|nr:glycosyltransferase family 2 protein [Polyangiaceae bacterium]
MKVGFVIPAYQAEKSVAAVVRGLFDALACDSAAPLIVVVDDGSTDGTGEAARAAGARVVRHSRNLGKGCALRTGFQALLEGGADAAVCVDADGQHPPEEAVRLARDPAPRGALVLGVRDLVRDGAPPANVFSNRFSNRFLSFALGRQLSDTQCGLRRYPLPETLELAGRAEGYGYEAELILRAARRGFQIVEVPVRVIYPPESERVTHFHSVRDPARIVYRVLFTLATAPRQRP